MQHRFHDWLTARTTAIELANLHNLTVAIRLVREFGRVAYVVTFACKMNSDYAKAEIVRPGDRI